MKIRELLMMETGEDMLGKPTGDMGPSMAPMAGNTMAGSMGGAAGTGMAATSPGMTPASPGGMAGTPSPGGMAGTPSPGGMAGTPSPGSAPTPAAPMKTAGLGSDFMNWMMSGPKPSYQGAPTPTQSMQSGPSAAGQAINNALGVNKVTGAMSQPQSPPKPNQ